MPGRRLKKRQVGLSYQNVYVKRAKTIVRLVGTLLCIVCLVPEAGAQTGVGAYMGIDTGRSNTLAGVQGRFGVPVLPFQIVPSFEVSLGEGLNRWQGNVDAVFGIGDQEAIWSPYLGAGFNGRHETGEDFKLGINALAGLRLVMGPIAPFAQFRLTTGGGGTQPSIMGGLVIRTWQ